MTPEQKDARVARAKTHAEQDRLRRGFYTDEDDTTHLLGCSVGCDAIDILGWEGAGERAGEEDIHSAVAEHDGTPEWLEYLRDVVFEGLPTERLASWHVELAEALPVTDDWEPYRRRICAEILRGVLRHSKLWDSSYGEQVVDAVQQTLAYLSAPSESAQSGALGAARSAARSARSAAIGAAESVARSAAVSAAVSAAESARSAALSAAESGADSVALSAAVSAARSARSAALSAAESGADSGTDSAQSAADSAQSAEYERIADLTLRVFRGDVK